MENDLYIETNGGDGGDEKPFEIIRHARHVVDYSIYLSENVESNFEYVKLLETLRRVTKDDSVTLYLANYGGYCSTGFQIANAIKECKSGVDIIVDAPCFSMAAILAVSGKSLKMNPGTFLMFHNYSGGDYGKGKERLDATVHYYEHFQKAIKNVCYPFLTKDELDAIKHDKDVYISWDERGLKNRMKRHFT